MPFTDSAETRMLSSVLTGDDFALALFNGVPSADGSGGAEVTGGGYSRVEVAFTVTAGTPSTATLSQTMEFPTATASWGEVTHCVIFNSAGQRVLFEAISTPREILAGDILRFTPDNFSVQIGALSDFQG